MTTQTKQAQPLFPSLPQENTVVDQAGQFTENWNLAFGFLFQALQKNFSNEGILFPSLTATQISSIQALYTPFIGSPLPQDNPSVNGQMFLPDISGSTVFDSTNRVPKQFIITFDGSTPPNILTAAWKTFTLT